MFNRRLFCKFVFVIFVASAICFSGCGDPDGSIDGPYIGGNPGTRNNNNRNAEIEAIKLYVDAVMLDEIKDRDQMITKLNTAIEYAPEFSLAYSFKGDIYQLNKEYQASADSYDEATKIDPWSFKDFSNLGKVCQIIENFSRAVKAYVSACELKTDDFNVHLGAGRCFYELKDFDQAFGYGQRAKEITPENGVADVLLGDIYSENKDFTEAVASYKRALETEDGNKPKTMVSLAVVYTVQKHFDSAEELLVSAIEKDPNSCTAFQYLGLVQLRRYPDDLNLALGSYKKAVEIDCKDWMASKGLGVVYMLKYHKLKDIAEQQGTLDQLDDTFKLKALESWKISMAIKPDPDLKLLSAKYLEL